MTSQFLFVGERPSNKALAMGVTWKDGRLAGKQLFDALRANNIDPVGQRYTNWFKTGDGPLVAQTSAARKVRRGQAQGAIVVAIGQKVARAMHNADISHLQVVHPAARGRIRAKAKYAKHIKEVLCGNDSNQGDGKVLRPLHSEGPRQNPRAATGRLPRRPADLGERPRSVPGLHPGLQGR